MIISKKWVINDGVNYDYEYGADMNILIPNVGRRGYLVDYIKQIKTFKGKVYVSDCDITASGLYGNNDGHFILNKPVDDEKKYIRQLIKLCKDKGIAVVIPVIDPEIDILSRHKDEFEKNDIKVIVSSKQVLEVCCNKLNMNKFLEALSLPVPMTYESIDLFKKAYKNKKIDFPVIIKPVYGSGSAKTIVVHNIKQLEADFENDMLIQEFIEDAVEYGADVFNTFEGKTVRCIIKRKISMRSGETDKSVTEKNEIVKKALLKMAGELGHIGNLDCDIMVKDNIPYIIDLNPRFGGGYPATHAAGANLLELIVKMANNETIEPDFDNYKENLLVMKTVGIATTLLDTTLK